MLDLVVEGPLSAGASVRLLAGEREIPLEVASSALHEGGFVSVACRMPVGLHEGLYDLVLVEEGARHVSPHAVYVCAEEGESFTFMHASDPHVLKGGNGDLEDRRDLIAALVARINAIRPAFVICTGDLISRYGAHKEVLSDEIIDWQVRVVQEMLLDLEVPFFVEVGNHDVAFPSSRRAWRTYMGWPWDRPTDDYAYDYGGCHFAVADGFAHYDGDNGLIDCSLTEEQCAWLQRDVRRAAASRWRFLFIHYDYKRQFASLLDGLGVDMVFYGHSDKGHGDVLGSLGIRNGHLLSDEAYRLVHVTPETLSSETVSWAELMGEEDDSHNGL